MGLLALHARRMPPRAEVSMQASSLVHVGVWHTARRFHIAREDREKPVLKSETRDREQSTKGANKKAVDRFRWPCPTEGRIGASEANGYKVA